MYTVEKLRKMRASARNKVLAENPELKAEWEKAQAERAEKPVSKPNTWADENGMFSYYCSECGNTFKAFGTYAKCRCCGEDTNGMVSLARA